ncbi:two-component regulator propeller domain-containing protein [Dysgonomonas sp. HGC4]|uniref:two-component regulator propeller domain-containing protein n=1 Tax=Dysgonomonas sp. HGC4 TaxID=1658009 RepID=UPI00068065AF|nr:two-component regulator propeller domain-containing protein [Dysgonomonas sp. HGC4]MBD8347572.1 response regulator [Dysgonomonas sp. HGC4]
MKNLLFLLLFSMSIICVEGKDLYYFSNLSLGNGLSQITGTSILQDSKGFMWFGTRNGLNRFDGYNFDVFITDAEDNSSISDNHILCMTEDNNQNLWIGTNNGLNCLNPSTNKFKRYYLEPNNKNSLYHNTILSIFFDDQNNLWVGTNQGLNLYDQATDSFRRITIDNLLEHNRVNAIVKKENKLYLGTLTEGLIVYNLENKQYTVYKNTPNDAYSISDDYVKVLFIDRNDNLWVGTQNKGISYLKKGAKEFTYYNENNGLTNNNIRNITEAPDGSIVVGTFNGLNVIDNKTREITQYKEYSSGQGALSHYSIISVYFDRSQTLWVGTYAGGICYYNRYGQKFQFYNPSASLKAILGIMGPIVETPSSLYIATEGGGLLEVDKKTESFKHYLIFDNANKVYQKNIIKSLYQDGSRILCGTNLGTIYSFDMSSHKFSLEYDLKEERSIYQIGKTRKGDLVISGVSEYGFSLILGNKDVRKEFPVIGKQNIRFSDVRSILEIETNVFLIGTRNNGLFYYDYNTHILKNYKNNPLENNPDKIPENFVTSIVKDSAGEIWIGTFGGGISLFDPKSDKFITYGTKDSLLNNNVCMIVDGGNRHLWISTSTGISDFNTDAKTFQNYTHSNGLKIDEFTLHAGLKLSNNNIIFSGSNGFVTFNPQRMTVNPYVPPIVFNNLYINNAKIVSGGEDKILKEQLNSQKKIVLKYDQSNISIEYSALNFIFADKNQYAYKLEGFDKEWNNVGSRRMAYYTNIPPGEYQFVVKGSNNDGVWNDEGASLKIVVLPPFWKTWWAYTFYVLFISGIILFIIRYFTERKRLENDIKLKQMEAKTQDEFHQARNKLFTNFSHELRTPLTLIINPLEDMVEKEDLTSKVRENMILMRSNARRLLRLVNNLMDFQKKESGTMSLKISENDFVKFSEEMVLIFRELAVSRKINFEFNHTIDIVNNWFDKSLMEKVYFNLLSNAFKNVPNGGVIDVNLSCMTLSEIKKNFAEKGKSFINEDISYIILEIKDSGTGIANDELEKIFIPFYQVAQNEHSASGTGLGLSLSKSIIEMHHGVIWAESSDASGAVFKCILPVCKDCFRDDAYTEEIVEETELPYTIDCSEDKESEEKKTVKRTTILVVEDNIDVRRYIISLLKDAHNIIEAANGLEAIDKAINHSPDLLISDLMMPKMDGMEMCKRIKTDLRTSHIPVIMITARAMTDDIKEGYEAGADEYIVKPFNSSLLIARVINILQARESLKEIYGKRFSLETLGVEASSVDERFMQKLYEILEKDVSNPELNLDDFSRDVGMSRANLYRKIKAITNLSPNEFIRNFRLNMGAKMLKEAKLPVSEVYVAVGFNSHAYFSNCFKTYFGMSPTEYTNQ